jgi:multiple sugar transport system permease protein
MANRSLAGSTAAPARPYVTKAGRARQAAAWPRLRRLLLTLLAYLLLTLVAIFFIMPFLWMVSGSLKSMDETFSVPPHLIPKVWHLSNYPRALVYVPFLRYLRNSLIICASTTLGTLLSCTLVAYSLSRVRWFGRGPLFTVVLASMMLPGQVTMIPLFITFRKLHWLGTYAPLIVPSFFGSAYYIFLIRQFFLTIPEALLDAARIDGAGELRIYWQLMLPLSLPVLATVTLFTFLGTWNDFLGPLIYLSKQELWTIAIGLRGFQDQHGWKWELLMAAATVFSLPSMILYLWVQRSFVLGIVTTGLK